MLIPRKTIPAPGIRLIRFKWRNVSKGNISLTSWIVFDACFNSTEIQKKLSLKDLKNQIYEFLRTN